MKQFKISLVFLLIALMTIATSYAQVMEWTLKPAWQEIVPLGGSLYKVQAANGKWGVYNVDKRLLTVAAEYDSITPLVEGRSLVLDKTGLYLYGILNENGNGLSDIVPASQLPGFIVSQDYPFYSEGLLAVGQVPVNGGNCKFGYVDKQGREAIPFKNYYACPFNNGLAMVWTERKTYRIINNYGAPQYQGNEEISFLSNPEDGEFMVVVKNKVRIARLEGGKFKTVRELNTAGRIVDVEDATKYHNVSCRGGETYRFDRAFHYMENNQEPDYSVVIPERKGHLNYNRTGNLFGITYDATTVLNEQFKGVRVYGDKYAVVAMNDGMKGMLEYNPYGKLTINLPSETVVFYHNAKESVPISVECTGYLSTPSVRLTCEGALRTLNGSGQVFFDFYEGHTKVDKVSTKSLPIDVEADGLKYGRITRELSSKHKTGFMASASIPSYGDINGNCKVEITISSIEGTPSSSAKATVNGISNSFNGRSSLKMTLEYEVPPGGELDILLKIQVTEDGCPTWSTTKTGHVEDISRK